MKKRKILHIEDNAENRLLVRRLLEPQDFIVIEREDGLSAVQAADEERPDLILMDINLPGIDGHQATTLIRGVRGMERVPIVAITSNVMPGAREEAIVAGCDGYISKPIDVDTFVAVINEFIAGRQEELSPDVKANYLVRYSRKLAEALETHTYARKFLEGVIVQNPLSTVITDVEGVCLMHNGAFVRMFNRHSPGGLVGRYNILEDPVLCRPPYREDLRRLYEGRERIEFMAQFPVPGKGDRSVKVFGFPILDDEGRLRNVVIQHEDVTEELRAIEEQQQLWEQLAQAQKMESIAELAGGVAQDFTNLLVGVLGSVELLLKNASPQDNSRQLLSMIKDSALRMSDLTKNLLAYSRRGASTAEVLDTNSVITEMLPLLKRLAGPRVELSVSLGPGLPPVLADRSQFQQVLMNVVLNAVEATPGAGTVTLSGAGPVEGPGISPQAKGPGEFVVFRVVDRGSGMTEDVRSRMFDPFFTTKEPGRGYGMAAVLGIVSNASGVIKVVSAPGQGTTVEIHWPVARKEGQDRRNRDPGAATGGETVLVVDRDERARNAARAILEGYGYRVFLAADAAEALLLAKRKSDIRLAVVDEDVDGRAGADLSAALKRTRPGIEIMVAATRVRDPAGNDAEAPTGAALIRKPLERDELLAAVGTRLRAEIRSDGGSVSHN